jgi:hypothetical protein
MSKRALAGGAGLAVVWRESVLCMISAFLAYSRRHGGRDDRAIMFPVRPLFAGQTAKGHPAVNTIYF